MAVDSRPPQVTGHNPLTYGADATHAPCGASARLLAESPYMSESHLSVSTGRIAALPGGRTRIDTGQAVEQTPKMALGIIPTFLGVLGENVSTTRRNQHD